MSRAAALLWAILCYAIFFATFLYLIAFVGDLPVPRTVDAPASSLAPVIAAIVDVALITLFGLQHSVMARPAFKRAWTRLISPSIERSVYVLGASVALIVLFAFWQPIEMIVWAVPAAMRWLSTILWIMFLGGFTIVLISTFLINHFELFGLQQVMHNLSGRKSSPTEFKTPFLYKFVRHPLYVGFIIAFWATPVMTSGHLLFAAVTTAYIFVGIMLEEQDLVAHFGPAYQQYREKVGMLMPMLRRSQ
jgi:methanethiol S-methyltransferase